MSTAMGCRISFMTATLVEVISGYCLIPGRVLVRIPLGVFARRPITYIAVDSSSQMSTAMGCRISFMTATMVEVISGYCLIPGRVLVRIPLGVFARRPITYIAVDSG